jgi:hypothetical protein
LQCSQGRCAEGKAHNVERAIGECRSRRAWGQAVDYDSMYPSRNSNPRVKRVVEEPGEDPRRLERAWQVRSTEGWVWGRCPQEGRKGGVVGSMEQMKSGTGHHPAVWKCRVEKISRIEF